MRIESRVVMAAGPHVSCQDDHTCCCSVVHCPPARLQARARQLRVDSLLSAFERWRAHSRIYYKHREQVGVKLRSWRERRIKTHALQASTRTRTRARRAQHAAVQPKTHTHTPPEEKECCSVVARIHPKPRQKEVCASFQRTLLIVHSSRLLISCRGCHTLLCVSS